MTDLSECRPEQVHLQITRNCNLRCYFCSQWGMKGAFSDAAGSEMTLKDWEKVIGELVLYKENTGISPFIMVWGGEPMVSPHFNHILTCLHKNGFKVGIVTNGVLSDRFTDTINTCIQKLYVSVDGPEQVHDKIRGKGVYRRVKENLMKINGPEITLMSVVTNELIEVLPDFIRELTLFNKGGGHIKRLFLQDMIGLTNEEAEDYRRVMNEAFGIQAKFIDSWENGETEEHHKETDEILKHFREENGDPDTPEIICKRHAGDEAEHCLAPFRHIHVNWNGEVNFCTDYYDFSAGNVREEPLLKIFFNEKSERFRRLVEDGKCPTCRHCSWRGNRQYL